MLCAFVCLSFFTVLGTILIHSKMAYIEPGFAFTTRVLHSLISETLPYPTPSYPQLQACLSHPLG